MTLRAKITIVAISVTFLVAIALIITSQISEKQAQTRFASATISGKKALWNKIISSEFDAMTEGVSGLARDRATRNALKNADYVTLAESAKTTFNLLSASKVLSRMQILTLSGEVVFSAPNKVNSTKKMLYKEALKDGKIHHGLERDDDGVLVAEISFPLFMRGKVIGVGIYAKKLDATVADFKATDNSELYVISESGNQEYSTDKSFYNSLEIDMPALGDSNVSIARIDDKAYSASILPIKSFNGKA